jgi:hypothetical protein
MAVKATSCSREETSHLVNLRAARKVLNGFPVTVLYWSHASRELREAATTFHELDAYMVDPALV